jgi:hypothetical protein
MIVRIMADNQYRVVDGHAAEITRLDNELMKAVDGGDDTLFRAKLQELIAHVHQNGQVVPDDELVPSDVMVPAEDMTLAEAQSVLQQAAVVPDQSGGTQP